MTLRDEIAALKCASSKSDDPFEAFVNERIDAALKLVDKHKAKAQQGEEMPGAGCTVAYEKWCATMGEPHPDGGPRCTPSMAFQAGFDAARNSKPSEDRPQLEYLYGGFIHALKNQEKPSPEDARALAIVEAIDAQTAAQRAQAPAMREVVEQLERVLNRAEDAIIKAMRRES